MEINVIEKIDNFLYDNLTQAGYELTCEIQIPDAWNRSTSSSGKWHHRPDGSIPTQAEHVYSMLINGKRIMCALDLKPNTPDADIFFLAIYYHDMYKYGIFGANERSEWKHDQLAADALVNDRAVFERVYSAEQVDRLITAVRYHTGRWSTDGPPKTTDPMVHMVHFLDMGDTNNVLRWEDDE